MATEGIIRSIPGLTASADLSALQYRFVTMSGADTVNVSGASESAIGVLQNKPISGLAANVAGLGSVSKITASAAIAAGVNIATAANGKAVTAGAGVDVVGQAIEAAGADNDVISMLVTLAPSP